MAAIYPPPHPSIRPLIRTAERTFPSIIYTEFDLYVFDSGRLLFTFAPNCIIHSSVEKYRFRYGVLHTRMVPIHTQRHTLIYRYIYSALCASRFENAGLNWSIADAVHKNRVKHAHDGHFNKSTFFFSSAAVVCTWNSVNPVVMKEHGNDNGNSGRRRRRIDDGGHNAHH